VLCEVQEHVQHAREPAVSFHVTYYVT
jgi:hypothetical protein